MPGTRLGSAALPLEDDAALDQAGDRLSNGVPVHVELQREIVLRGQAIAALEVTGLDLLEQDFFHLLPQLFASDMSTFQARKGGYHRVGSVNRLDQSFDKTARRLRRPYSSLQDRAMGKGRANLGAGHVFHDRHSRPEAA
jgi:hypothetical protein